VDREELSVSWGVELTSDSKKSLTITRVSKGGCFDACEAFKTGDVIVAVNQFRIKSEMVAQLKEETEIHLSVVRFKQFEVVLQKASDAEPLDVELEAASAKSLVVKAITSPPKGNSALVRYNNANFEKPLVAGDVIVSANGSSDMKTMVAQLKNSTTITMIVKRAYV